MADSSFRTSQSRGMQETVQVPQRPILPGISVPLDTLRLGELHLTRETLRRLIRTLSTGLLGWLPGALPTPSRLMGPHATTMTSRLCLVTWLPITLQPRQAPCNQASRILT